MFKVSVRCKGINTVTITHYHAAEDQDLLRPRIVTADPDALPDDAKCKTSDIDVPHGLLESKLHDLVRVHSLPCAMKQADLGATDENSAPAAAARSRELSWHYVAVAVHEVLVSVRHHAGTLLQHPAAHLQWLIDTGDQCMVAACVMALACDDAAKRRGVARAVRALNRRLGTKSPLRSLSTAAPKVGDDRGHDREFCRSVFASVDLAACGFDDPDGVRARLDKYDGLWKLLPAPDVGLPTAAWWAQWCDGDMQQCRPMGRSMPAHAVLASLLQLSNAANPRARLFAERIYDLFALRGGKPGSLGNNDTVVLEPFVDDEQQASQREAHRLASKCGDDVEYFASVARSVAIGAVQHAGGRYRHLGIARRPPTTGEGRDFEAVKRRFLERAAVAVKRHGALDMGVAAPVLTDKTPVLADIVDAGVCRSVPLTLRRYDFDVTRATAERWLHPDAFRGEQRPLCATFASRGQGKTVQLLLSLGLLVEAYGGAALYATGNRDQERTVQLMLRQYKDVAHVDLADVATALAVFHRACLAHVCTVSKDPGTEDETKAFDPAVSHLSDVLCKKLLKIISLDTALCVARELLGCHDKEAPLFLAVDEVAHFAQFADDLSKEGSTFKPHEALKNIITAASVPSLFGRVVPIAGALDCLDLEKLASTGASRPMYLLPLSALVPMDRPIIELLPPLAKAICCQRAEFKNPSDSVRSVLGRVGALLLSTGGHGRVLSVVLTSLRAVSEQHVVALKKSFRETQHSKESQLAAQREAIQQVVKACEAGENAVSANQTTFEQYECQKLQHPRLGDQFCGVIEDPDNANRVLRHLTAPFKLPALHTGSVAADDNAVLRRYMNKAWEFSAASGHGLFKIYPPPVALPAVLSRFLADAASTDEGADPEFLKGRLTSLFDLVLETNYIGTAFVEGGAGASDEDVAPLERPKLFELAVGRVLTLLLMLPTGLNGRGHWLANHMQLCCGARTLDPLHGVILPYERLSAYSLEHLRKLSTSEIHARLAVNKNDAADETQAVD